VVTSFAAQLFAAGGSDVAIIDLDLAASGTTLAAEAEFPATKPDGIITAFDHVAREAKNLLPHAAGWSDALWNITPPFLGRSGGGRIWLLPAREPANPGQSFDVVANVLPPEQREGKLAAIVQTQIDRIRRKYPTVRAILIDCGAERNPIYGAAFSKAGRGYILFGPSPDFFGEVKAVRDELLRTYPAIAVGRIHAVASNVASLADVERCRVGIAPAALAGAIPHDPLLARASAEGQVGHLDLGHDAVAAAIVESLDRLLKPGDAVPIEERHLAALPLTTLFLGAGGLEEVSRMHRKRVKIAVVTGVVAVISAVASAAGFAYTASDGTTVGLGRAAWVLAIVMSALALSAAVWLWWKVRAWAALLQGFASPRPGAPPELFAAVERQIAAVRRQDPQLAALIGRWTARRQHEERRKR
jgi:hypothetical protein